MTTTRDFLDTVEAQLVAAAERGAAQQPQHPQRPRSPQRRPRRGWLALVPAVAAAAAVIAVVIGLATGGGTPRHRPVATHHPTAVRHSTHRNHARHHPVHTHRPSNPTAPMPAVASPSGPVPPGFGASSFTAISETTWWLLGSAPCASPPCTSIVRTTDGGRRFVGIPAPRTAKVSQLRFADAQDGFAFGPELWVTHDAGAHWTQLQVGGNVSALEAGGGSVFAVVQTPGGGGRLLRAPVAGGPWQPLAVPGIPFGGLWASAKLVTVETESRTGAGQQLLVSGDGGATFAAHAAPPSIVCGVQAPAPPVIWAHCATGMMSATWRSTDGGAAFSQTEVGPGGPVPTEPNSAPFAAASSSTAVVGFQQLFRTADGGAHFFPVPGTTGVTWQYLGFTDATHGVAIGHVGDTTQPSSQRLFYTTDGGASYHRVLITGS